MGGSLGASVAVRRMSREALLRQRGQKEDEHIIDNPQAGVETDAVPGQLVAKVNRFANIASFLCVLDCTVLPVLTVALQLTGFTSESKMHALHELGHRVALYFVLPVGGTAALSNFASHGRKRISVFALLGLLGIYAANGHSGLLSRLPHA